MMQKKAIPSKRTLVPFAHKLVLNQWLLSLFNVHRFEELARQLRDESLEGLDENNIHRFHHALTAHHFDLTQLPSGLLLEYDQNIVRHTHRLNERRLTRGEEPIVWKYFQYLALLFSEIYLDRYFRNPEALLAELNAQLSACNSDLPESDRIAPFDEAAEAWPQLNKVAFWMATGSGKTLLMHANILQYQDALSRQGRRRDLNRILLLTPNEGLSEQHLREFDAAGIAAEMFNRDPGKIISSQAVEVLEVTRLRDEMGTKTIAVDALEGNNLVLVDEGHRGASAGQEGAWMRFRNTLCARGFSFEYSATFGQAVKGKPELSEQYAKSTLCDYSYRYFYADGFGKDYQILNLDLSTQQNQLDLYLIACLLSFFQQQRLYREQFSTFRPFNIEKPLWIFVGGRVTKTLSTKDASDILEILQFLARYAADRVGSTQQIRRVLSQGLVTSTGQNLLTERFVYLNTCGLEAEQVFDETLGTLFNAPGGGQLHVENLKGATGEVALRLGVENEAFGVINVGDDTKLVKLCERSGLSTGEREFSGSLFQEINQPHSTVHLLIGSRKFTEGWSSWRVSTMGLMNVGKKEGAQIIQLFGRGVRLKGYGLSLKRSSGKTRLPEGEEPPKHIDVLETLGIFGVHADYMAQFREFLEEEGLQFNDMRIEILLPVIKNIGRPKLKTIRLKKTINGVSTEFGDAYRKLAPVPTLAPPEPGSDQSKAYLQNNQVLLNWYPKIKAMKSHGLNDGVREAEPNETHLRPRHVAFLDLDRIWLDLERFKAERGWSNLNITRQGLEALLGDQSWYRLRIPAEELTGDSYKKVQLWEEIAVALLKKYTERYYLFRKSEWELPHLEYCILDDDDPNFLSVKDSPDQGYRIVIDKSQEEIVTKLNELKVAIQKGQLKPWEFRGIKAIFFGQHLYEPLLSLNSDVVEITPTPLNEGERRFVEDLKEFHDGNAGYFKTRELYLLRNLSRGKGVGFFEAGNFHPDFILWLITDNQQNVIFVDPKGIRHIGPDDPKIQFYETIKKIEHRLADRAVRLESFTVSNTPSATMQRLWVMEKGDMQKRHILFQEEDKGSYVGAMLNR